jgi:hypothetical protein
MLDALPLTSGEGAQVVVQHAVDRHPSVYCAKVYARAVRHQFPAYWKNNVSAPAK